MNKNKIYYYYVSTNLIIFTLINTHSPGLVLAEAVVKTVGLCLILTLRMCYLFSLVKNTQ